MGLHSTVFGPVKYAILPQQLREEEIVGGNGLVEMGTFLAILMGTLLGGFLIAEGSPGPVSATVIGLAVLGYLASRWVPLSPAAAPGLVLNWNPFSETWRILGFMQKDRTVFLSVLGISWFWFLGAVYLSQFPVYTQGRALGERAGRDGAARALFGGRGRRVAAVRADVRAQDRDRPRTLRLDRPHAFRPGFLFREHRARRARCVRRLCVPRRAGALADPRRPRADRRLRRLLHRAAVRAGADALGGERPLARHRRQQRAQRPVRRRCGADRDRAARPRIDDPAAVPRGGPDERRRGDLHLRAGARVPDALPHLAAGAHHLPRTELRPGEHSRIRAGAARRATT